ncbi:MAG TPA: aminopeptidase P N-terminal domain-containing protein [Longimicrobium sp.]|jgi:Xaa-Pro aminopeptidase
MPADATSEIHRLRRERFLGEIGGGVAILCALPELVKSRDTEIRYRPDSDLFYLTGFAEPGTVAVLTPHDAEHRLTLFVRARNPERELWDGPRAGPEGAREKFGATAAYPLTELDERLRGLLEPADAIVYSLGSDAAMDGRVTELLRGFRRTRPRSGKGPADVRDPATVLDRMRTIKEPGELDQIRASAEISARAHAAAMRMARPGVGEWELEARIDSTFRAAGPTAGTAFPTIVGSGTNATVLHYVDNARRTGDGDLVLIDAGAALGLYCSDITRTFPVNGRFTPAQREVYEVVLAAEEAAIAAIQPGAPFTAIHEAARRILVQGMIDFGLVTGTVDEVIEAKAHQRYFMHQTSHFLGLDVHDVGAYAAADGSPVALEPGMLLTVEPGLYIPDAEDVPERYRGIGVRIEDDVIVTTDGHEVITRAVPVHPDEIESLVGSE